MRKVHLGILYFAAIAVLTATAYAAAAKSYQFTGTVKSVDGTTFTVQKSATETWDFSTDASTKGTPKVGDKVTVQYRMVATNIETKPSTAPAPSAKPATDAAADKPAAPAKKK
jgi:hypothetical protein